MPTKNVVSHFHDQLLDDVNLPYDEYRSSVCSNISFSSLDPAFSFLDVDFHSLDQVEE
jgi:hypothetical protein